MKRLFAALALTALFVGPAHALMSFLVAQWYENGSQMCRYDNGTVLNVGVSLCPLSIGR
jgi:hypothetical protein